MGDLQWKDRLDQKARNVILKDKWDLNPLQEPVLRGPGAKDWGNSKNTEKNITNSSTQQKTQKRDL